MVFWYFGGAGRGWWLENLVLEQSCAILEPTSPNKCFSHLFKHPQIPKNLCFPLVFVGFLLSSPCAKIVPKCSQHAPKTSQVEPKIAILALSWPVLGATCCQLGPNFAHLAPIFAPTCAEISRKSRPGRQEPLQDPPRRLQVPVLWFFLASGASFFMVCDPSRP